MKRLLEDLIAFMEIPSVTGEEERLAAHIGERLASTGRPIVRDGRSVLIPPASDSRPLVLLAGHLDTVPPRGNETPRIEADAVWGRGSSDMKSGLAVLASLLDDPRVGSGWARVGAIFYAAEEGPIEENDLRRILRGGPRWLREAELVILLEPTDLTIEVGCLGVVNLDVIFRGEACHSARPWLGTNALTVALPWIERITAHEPREHRISGYLFRETATVTRLRAGTARNMVPGELVMNLNYRFPPGWDVERGRRAAMELAMDATEVRLVDLAPSGEVPLDRPHFAAFVSRSGRESRAKQAWTDVAQFSEIGVPALNFGPGDPNLAHRDDERVRIGAMDECLATVASFLLGEEPFEGVGSA